MQNETGYLHQLLEPERLSVVVDIGANPIDGTPPYKNMLDQGLCRVIGFEPQQDALQVLVEKAGPLETYLPYAIGDGEEHTLYTCVASGMTSLLKPDPRYLATFNNFEKWGRVKSTQQIPTSRLDDVSEICHMDMLKIDIQGGELSVFESGRKRLHETVAIQTEASFVTLYENQAQFWEVDRELRQQGFIPHTFEAVKNWPISPYAHPEHHLLPLNQLLEADIVYVRDFVNAETMADEQVKQLALLAHHCYKSYDLAIRCLSILSERGCVAQDAMQCYRNQIFPESNPDQNRQKVNYSISFNL